MRKLQEISNHWDALEQNKDPVLVNLGLQQQQRRIDQLMLQKDTIIAECQRELLSADENYNKGQEKQSEELECLVDRVNHHVETMKLAYRDQLEQLQMTITRERVAKAHEAEDVLNELFDCKREQELVKLRDQREQLVAADRELEAMVLSNEELIRSEKTRLEMDNETLQLELQKTKADILLNTEKLDYNFEVFKRREEESGRNQQKKQLTKLNDTISQLKNNLKHRELASGQETKRLQTDIAKIKGQIRDLTQSSSAIEAANERKVSRKQEKVDDQVNILNYVKFTVSTMLANERVRLSANH